MTAMHLKIQSSSVHELTSANKSFLFRSQSGKRPAPKCKGAGGSSTIFTSTMRFFSKRHFVFGRSIFFALQTVFFLFFQPLSRWRYSFKPGASFVLIIGHCFLRFDVPKVICITVFDQKTVSHSFFDSANHFWSQIVVYIILLKKTPFCDFSASVLFNTLRKSAVKTS